MDLLGLSRSLQVGDLGIGANEKGRW